MQHSIII